MAFMVIAAATPQGDSRQDAPHSGSQPEGRASGSPRIVATFNAVVQGPTGGMVYFYIFRNNSSQEYEIPGDASTRLYAVLAGRKHTARLLSAQEMYVRYPIVIHPHQVQIVTLHDKVRAYVVNDHLKMNPTREEYARYEIVARAAVRKSWPELNGFRMDDERTGQSILLPRPF